MCASCWNMEPSSTMVLSIFCIVSARLWMYESCNGTTRKILKKRVNGGHISFIEWQKDTADQLTNTQQQSTCSSISWSCRGLVWESILMATSPRLLDSSCIRTELSEGRQQAKTRTNIRQDQTGILDVRGEKQKEQRAHTVASYTRWESQTFQGNTF